MKGNVLLTLLLILTNCVNHDLNPDPACELSDLKIFLQEVKMASGCGIPDGTIRIQASGGIEPYVYTINDQQTTDGFFDQLTSGVYSVQVIDANGCVAMQENVSLLASGFSFTADVKENSSCSGGNGSLEINVLEGAQPFMYKIDDGSFSDNNIFSGLKEGTYSIVIKDGEGCSSNLSLTVPKGDTKTSWSTTIQPLMTTYCALTGCHNGVSRPDLRLYTKAKFYASQIKTKTRDRSMPFTGTLTQEQIDLISCWVDEGAKDN